MSAFTECFVSGGCAATYWQVVGWFDTPVIVGTATVERVLRWIISLASIATAVILLFFFTRNLYRIVRSACRGHWFWAFKVAFGDPVINSYLCFVAFIFALFAVTNNSFGVEGRHWYPVIFATFLCFVWYAPRALARRRPMLSFVLTAALLCYVFVSSGYAAAAISHRYYGPQVAKYTTVYPLPGQPERGHAGTLWPVISAGYHVVGSVFPTRFTSGTPLLAEGVVKPIHGDIPRLETVVLDEKKAVPVLSNQYNFRLGEAGQDVHQGYNQFYATIRTVGLSEGPHVVTAYAQSKVDTRFNGLSPSRLFFLTPSGNGFSQAYIQRLAQAHVVDGDLRFTGVCRGDWSKTGSATSIDSNSVLLLYGRTLIRRSGSSLVAAWLLVNKRPYPARPNFQDSSFDATVPAADLGSGRHDVTAFAMYGHPLSIARIAHPITFEVRSSRARNSYLANPPAACDDPLRELAGT